MAHTGETGQPGEDRRLFSRVKCLMPAILRHSGARWDCRLLDISLNGALIELPSDLATSGGERFELQIPCAPVNSTISAEVVVVFAANGRIGCKFDTMTEESVRLLREFILSLVGPLTLEAPLEANDEREGS